MIPCASLQDPGKHKKQAEPTKHPGPNLQQARLGSAALHFPPCRGRGGFCPPPPAQGRLVTFQVSPTEPGFAGKEQKNNCLPYIRANSLDWGVKPLIEKSPGRAQPRGLVSHRRTIASLAGKGRSGAKRAGHGEAAGTRGCRERRWHGARGWTRKRAVWPSPGARTVGRWVPRPGAARQGQAQGTTQPLQHPLGRSLQPSGPSLSAVAKTQAVVPITGVACGRPRLRAANERFSKRRYFAGILVY